MQSIAVVKSIVAIHIFDAPLLAFLFNHPVRRQAIQRLVRTPEPSLIFGLNLFEPGMKSVVQDSRKHFVQRWQNTNRATVSDIFFVVFFL